MAAILVHLACSFGRWMTWLSVRAVNVRLCPAVPFPLARVLLWNSRLLFRGDEALPFLVAADDSCLRSVCCSRELDVGALAREQARRERDASAGSDIAWAYYKLLLWYPA